MPDQRAIEVGRSLPVPLELTLHQPCPEFSPKRFSRAPTIAFFAGRKGLATVVHPERPADYHLRRELWGLGGNVEMTTRRKEACSMRCPYCGDRRTEVLKTVYRGHNSYRHRRCVYCGSRFSTQERPVRWSRVERKWPGPRPSRKGWRKRRTSVFGGNCDVESCGIDFKQAEISRHVGHIVPARLIRRLRAGNPDRRENLQCICGPCHGRKVQALHQVWIVTHPFTSGLGWTKFRRQQPRRQRP